MQFISEQIIKSKKNALTGNYSFKLVVYNMYIFFFCGSAES